MAYSFLRSFCLALLIAAASVSPSLAETQPSSEELSFRIAPYVWATALNGDIGVEELSAHVNATMGEVLDHVDGAAMLTAEARLGRFGLVTDFIYSDVADREYSDTGLIREAKVKVDQYIWSQAVAYRAIDSGGLWFDVLAGFRLMSVNQKFTIRAVDPKDQSQELTDTASLDRTWVDPIIGIRSAVPVHDAWSIRTEGDIGGFDANSQLTWQAFAALAYDATDATRVLVGYRGLGYNHNRDDFIFDAVMHGPIVGVGVGF